MEWLWHNCKLQKTQHSFDPWRTSVQGSFQCSGLRGGTTDPAALQREEHREEGRGWGQ